MNATQTVRPLYWTAHKAANPEYIATRRHYANHETRGSTIAATQAALYAMIGGGMLGRSAVDQPLDFYLDGRVGRLPYGKRQIMAALDQYVAELLAADCDPRRPPAMPLFPNLGVF